MRQHNALSTGGSTSNTAVCSLCRRWTIVAQANHHSPHPRNVSTHAHCHRSQSSAPAGVFTSPPQCTCFNPHLLHQSVQTSACHREPHLQAPTRPAGGKYVPSAKRRTRWCNSRVDDPILTPDASSGMAGAGLHGPSGQSGERERDLQSSEPDLRTAERNEDGGNVLDSTVEAGAQLPRGQDKGLSWKWGKRPARQAWNLGQNKPEEDEASSARKGEQTWSSRRSSSGSGSRPLVEHNIGEVNTTPTSAGGVDDWTKSSWESDMQRHWQAVLYGMPSSNDTADPGASQQQDNTDASGTDTGANPDSQVMHGTKRRGQANLHSQQHAYQSVMQTSDPQRMYAATQHGQANLHSQQQAYKSAMQPSDPWLSAEQRSSGSNAGTRSPQGPKVQRRTWEVENNAPRHSTPNQTHDNRVGNEENDVAAIRNRGYDIMRDAVTKLQTTPGLDTRGKKAKVDRDHHETIRRDHNPSSSSTTTHTSMKGSRHRGALDSSSSTSSTTSMNGSHHGDALDSSSSSSSSSTTSLSGSRHGGALDSSSDSGSNGFRQAGLLDSRSSIPQEQQPPPPPGQTGAHKSAPQGQTGPVRSSVLSKLASKFSRRRTPAGSQDADSQTSRMTQHDAQDTVLSGESLTTLDATTDYPLQEGTKGLSALSSSTDLFTPVDSVTDSAGTVDRRPSVQASGASVLTQAESAQEGVEELDSSVRDVIEQQEFMKQLADLEEFLRSAPSKGTAGGDGQLDDAALSSVSGRNGVRKVRSSEPDLSHFPSQRGKKTAQYVTQQDEEEVDLKELTAFLLQQESQEEQHQGEEGKQQMDEEEGQRPSLIAWQQQLAQQREKFWKTPSSVSVEEDVTASYKATSPSDVPSNDSSAALPESLGVPSTSEASRQVPSGPETGTRSSPSKRPVAWPSLKRSVAAVNQSALSPNKPLPSAAKPFSLKPKAPQGTQADDESADASATAERQSNDVDGDTSTAMPPKLLKSQQEQPQQHLLQQQQDYSGLPQLVDGTIAPAGSLDGTTNMTDQPALHQDSNITESTSLTLASKGLETEPVTTQDGRMRPWAPQPRVRIRRSPTSATHIVPVSSDRVPLAEQPTAAPVDRRTEQQQYNTDRHPDHVQGKHVAQDGVAGVVQDGSTDAVKDGSTDGVQDGDGITDIVQDFGEASQPVQSELVQDHAGLSAPSAAAADTQASTLPAGQVPIRSGEQPDTQQREQRTSVWRSLGSASTPKEADPANLPEMQHNLLDIILQNAPPPPVPSPSGSSSSVPTPSGVSASAPTAEQKATASAIVMDVTPGTTAADVVGGAANTGTGSGQRLSDSGAMFGETITSHQMKPAAPELSAVVPSVMLPTHVTNTADAAVSPAVASSFLPSTSTADARRLDVDELADASPHESVDAAPHESVHAAPRESVDARAQLEVLDKFQTRTRPVAAGKAVKKWSELRGNSRRVRQSLTNLTAQPAQTDILSMKGLALSQHVAVSIGAGASLIAPPRLDDLERELEQQTGRWGSSGHLGTSGVQEEVGRITSSKSVAGRRGGTGVAAGAAVGKVGAQRRRGRSAQGSRWQAEAAAEKLLDALDTTHSGQGSTSHALSVSQPVNAAGALNTTQLDNTGNATLSLGGVVESLLTGSNSSTSSGDGGEGRGSFQQSPATGGDNINAVGSALSGDGLEGRGSFQRSPATGGDNIIHDLGSVEGRLENLGGLPGSWTPASDMAWNRTTFAAGSNSVSAVKDGQSSADELTTSRTPADDTASSHIMSAADTAPVDNPSAALTVPQSSTNSLSDSMTNASTEQQRLWDQTTVDAVAGREREIDMNAVVESQGGTREGEVVPGPGVDSVLIAEGREQHEGAHAANGTADRPSELGGMEMGELGSVDPSSWQHWVRLHLPDLYRSAYSANIHPTLPEFLPELWAELEVWHEKGFQRTLSKAYRFIEECYKSSSPQLSAGMLFSFVEYLPLYPETFQNSASYLSLDFLLEAVLPAMEQMMPEDVDDYFNAVVQVHPGLSLKDSGNARFKGYLSDLMPLKVAHPELDYSVLALLLPEQETSQM